MLVYCSVLFSAVCACALLPRLRVHQPRASSDRCSPWFALTLSILWYDTSHYHKRINFVFFLQCPQRFSWSRSPVRTLVAPIVKWPTERSRANFSDPYNEVPSAGVMTAVTRQTKQRRRSYNWNWLISNVSSWNSTPYPRNVVQVEQALMWFNYFSLDPLCRYWNV